MPVEGAIAERVRGVIPVTWDALITDPRYGDGLLRSVIDTAKESVTGANLSPAAESTYPLIVIDYIAKVAALDLIPAGLDFWANTPISESLSGTEETRTYESRVEALKALREELLRETRARQPEIANLIGFVRASGRAVPAINTMNDPFLTPSPQEFPRPYLATERS
jgi:hypothetical protein